jgi:uncharacterized membrane protein YqaE (UPF0057 family)
MMYLLAILVPPLAVLLTGRIFSALLNCVLTLLGWLPGVIHAFFVVSDHKAEVRNQKLIRALKRR